MPNEEYVFTRTTYEPNKTPKVSSSEIYYYDRNGDPTSSENATSCRIVEFDSNNEIVRETYGNIEKQVEEAYNDSYTMKR
mgnify:FL=1